MNVSVREEKNENEVKIIKIVDSVSASPGGRITRCRNTRMPPFEMLIGRRNDLPRASQRPHVVHAILSRGLSGKTPLLVLVRW
ncbi:hypothetical protein MTO96_020379 [Rhipicephalus appendiculatus]